MMTGIYARVSTEEQAKEGYSIRAQQEKLRNYVKIKDWSLYKVYVDEGISGKNITERPAINEMIKDIISGKVKNVLVYKIDRLTRSTKDLIELIDVFNKNDCAFNSLMESIDTQTASGRMFLKIVGIFAEFERENLVERVKLGYEKKAREGYTTAKHIVSYGYDRPNGVKVQTINEEEAEIVREVFNKFVYENTSLTSIARELNIRNVKTKLDVGWTNISIKNLLTNCNYVGKVRYAMTDEKRYFEAKGRHEPIISQELFDEARKKLTRIERKINTKWPKENNYFIGTLYCGLCGEKMSTHTQYRVNAKGESIYYGQYRCYNIKKQRCSAGVISHRKLEAAFREYIDNIEDLRVSKDIDLTKQMETQNNNELIRRECNEVMLKLERKEKDIMTLYIDEKINFDEYTKMMSLVITERKKVGQTLENIPEDVGEVTISAEDIITNIRENWDLLTDSERMQFLHTYVEKIIAYNDFEDKVYHGKIKIKEIKFYNN